MKSKYSLLTSIYSYFILIALIFYACDTEPKRAVKVFEITEVTFHTVNDYNNPYTEIEMGVELSGPEFYKKIYGFWNGNNEFVVRIAATRKGEWNWKSFSNQEDSGLNNKFGSFKATEWSKEELKINPNRRGFIRSTENGHALEYADGEPFFMLGDTWWAASTWRFPFKGIKPDDNYIPAENNISFENTLNFRKNQGYNTIAMIAAFPNWYADEYPAAYINADSIGVRQAWEKNGLPTGKDMHDEHGNMPFEPWKKMKIIADYDRINPAYFKSLDKKIAYLNEEGFIAFLETVRRDHGPTWKKYFNFEESYARYVQYIVARYGAYNLIFSGIHLDWINEDFCLPADEFNDVLTYHHKKYGGLPYGQPHTILIDGSTYERFGHNEEAPWLTMHSVGNVPRNHGFYPMIEKLFHLEPPYPAANLEPYYPGWDNVFHNNVAGERPIPNSDRDNYFGRTQMYGSVLSGGLAGHIYGSGAYCGSTNGEPKLEGERPYIWEGLNYPSGAQLEYLGKFILSEGKSYQECIPAKENLHPHKSKDAPVEGLDGYSFMLLSPKKDLAFIYFENKSEIPKISGLMSNQSYQIMWFNTTSGEWTNIEQIDTDNAGEINLNSFPSGSEISQNDWALKLKIL